MTKPNKTDLTQGSIVQHYAHIGIPASLGFIFNTFYNVTDTWYGGKISGDALAGLSLSFPAFFIVLALGLGIGTAAVVLISNAIGAKKNDNEVMYFTQSILLGLIISIILLSLQKLYIVPLFTIMGASGESLNMAVNYMETIIDGLPFFIINNILNSMLNARGDTKSYRNALIVGFFINLGLDPLFLYGYGIIPAMGIRGIALATVSVQILTLAYLVYQVSKIEPQEGKKIFSLIRADFTHFFLPHSKVIKDILQQAFPAILNSMSVATGMFVTNYFLNSYTNANAVAGYGVGLRIEQIFLLPAMGISVALVSIVGQNFGAQNYNRVRSTFNIGLKIGAVSFAITALVLTPFAKQLANLFSSDKNIIEYIVFYLRVEVFAYYCYILLPVCNSTLQAIKKPLFVMWMGFTRQLLLPTVVFYVLSTIFGMQARGIFIGIASINWLAALVSFCYTRYLLKNLDKNIL